MLRLWLIFFILFSTQVYGQVADLAIVDAETEAVSDEERKAFLMALREKMSEQSAFRILREDDIKAKLTVENDLAKRVQELRASQQRRYSQLKSQFSEARQGYSSSRFAESISIFENIWRSLNSVSLVLEWSFTEELLFYWASLEYLSGEEVKARTYFGTLLDLSPQAFIDINLFPPNVVEFFNRIKSAPRYPYRAQFVKTNQAFEAKVLGKRLETRVVEGGVEIVAPFGHSVAGNAALALEAEGHAPRFVRLKELPDEIRFRSLQAEPLKTSQLFGVLGTLTRSPALNEVVSLLDVDVVLLADLSKDLDSKYLARAQWLELMTDRRSSIVTASDRGIEALSAKLKDKLLAFLSPEGKVISASESEFSPKPPQSLVRRRQKRFYETWWFWTAVGAGIVGGGVGGYFLFKPDDKTRFVVEPAE